MNLTNLGAPVPFGALGQALMETIHEAIPWFIPAVAIVTIGFLCAYLIGKIIEWAGYEHGKAS